MYRQKNVHLPVCPENLNCLLRTVNGNQLQKIKIEAAHPEGLGAQGAPRLGPPPRGANSAAMPTDEYDQDGHFFFNHPERGGYSAA